MQSKNRYIHFYLSACTQFHFLISFILEHSLGNSATHSIWAFLPQLNKKRQPLPPDISQLDLNNTSLRLSAQEFLNHMELTITIHHHRLKIQEEKKDSRNKLIKTNTS